MKLFFGAVIIFQVVYTQEFSKTIEDNSFFIEEAYNQEEGIIQHIFTNTVSATTGGFDASVTEEWPLFGQTHQASITIPYIRLSSAAGGIGDVLVNYRYQITNENNLAVAPRISIILPVGDNAKGFGSGVVGGQCNLSVSRRWSNEFVSHFNAGITVLPNVNTGAGTATQTTSFAGVSAIYLAAGNVNVMLETLFSSGNGSHELVCNPGVRYAVDIGELQIVPGIAFPFYFTSAGQDNGMFLYLSFEHPY